MEYNEMKYRELIYKFYLSFYAGSYLWRAEIFKFP